MAVTTVFSKLLGWKKAMRASSVLALGLFVAGCQVGPVSLGEGGPTVASNGPAKVALLLPYGSGRGGDTTVAKALEDAARMALADLDGINVDLTVYNTAGNASTGAAMAQKAADEGAVVILGPLYADVAAAAGVAVSDENIPVLAFSNNTAIAGGNIYLLGNTFVNTASRVLSYASSKGHKKVVMLHGRDTAGNAARDAVQGAAAVSGVQIAGVVSYEVSQTGVVSAAPKVKSTVNSSGATGVFLTSSTAGALPIFAQLLPEAGVRPGTTQYMGLARWDVPAEALKLPGLQGGWFALPDPAIAAQFKSRFSDAYGKAPHPLAGLGYDGMAAVGTILSGGARKIGPSQLTRSSGFAGVNGAFRLLSDGTNQRALAVAEIKNNQVQVVSPAPRRFGSAGS